jgi:hypothetical protein
VEKNVREWLPDAQAGDHRGWHQADPEKHFLMGVSSRENPNEHLQKKDREGRDDEPLNTRGDVKVEAYPIVPDARL